MALIALALLATVPGCARGHMPPSTATAPEQAPAPPTPPPVMAHPWDPIPDIPHWETLYPEVLQRQRAFPNSLNGVRFDPETMDLFAAADFLMVLDARDCNTLARRAHLEAMRLEAEADPTDVRIETLLPRFRLHAIAAFMQDPAGDSRPGFFGNVHGRALSLHELRDAQLLDAQLGLVQLEYDEIVRSRMGTIVMYLRDFHDLPDFDDPELTLARLRLVVE